MSPIIQSPHQELAEKIIVAMFAEANIDVVEDKIDAQGDFFETRAALRCHKIQHGAKYKSAVIVYSNTGALDEALILTLSDVPMLLKPYLIIVQWRLPTGPSSWAKQHFNVAHPPYTWFGGGFIYTKPLSTIAKLPPGLQERFESIFLGTVV